MVADGIAIAEPDSELSTCNLSDGETADDAQAINSKWLAWAKVNEAASSDEYAPLGEAFDELQTCSGNRLWSGTATK